MTDRAVAERSLVDLPYGDLLDVVAVAKVAPGGGSVAALAAASAAALVERCAAASPAGEGERARVRAVELRAELVTLADQDAHALTMMARAVSVARSGGGGDVPSALAAASGPPARLRDAAAEVAVLAADLEAHGAPRLRGEARCAWLLADAALRAAESIVGLNTAFAARKQ